MPPNLATLARMLETFVLAIASVAGACFPGQTPAAPNPAFPFGVAAGDVTDQSAVCWTQTPAAENLRFELASDNAFAAIVQSTNIATDAATGLAAKVSLTDLTPQRSYHYRFVRLRDGSISPAGAFRTAPIAADSIPFHFVYTGDSHAGFQPFHILSFARQESPDLWFWFGDTIYGDGVAGGLGIATTLDEYRDKYRQNLADPHLQALLAASPVWVGWDDHEVGNDYDGADPESRYSRQQIDEAYRAFFEQLPIRDQGIAGDARRVYRSFRYGALAEFFILDGRQYRSADAARVLGNGIETLDPFGYFLPTRSGPFIALARDPSRSMLGVEQREWLKRSVTESTAQYKFIINPVPFTSLLVLPDDRWDGYDAERYDILRTLDLAGAEGVIVLTTDSHANTVNPDVTQYLRYKLFQPFSAEFAVPEFIAGPIGVDTVGGVVRGAVASFFGGQGSLTGELVGGFLELVGLSRIISANALTFAEPEKFAYLSVDVRPDGVTLSHRGIPTRNRPDEKLTTLRTTELDARGRASGVPCFLLPLLGFGAMYIALSRGSRRA